MTPQRQAERDAIEAAMDRLFAGTPTRSSGALTVDQLATEAGVKRWVLTHKHPDLRLTFEERRRAHSGVPAAYGHLAARLADLEADNARLRTDNAELTERVGVYAQVIRELTLEREHPRASEASATPAVVLRRDPPRR